MRDLTTTMQTAIASGVIYPAIMAQLTFRSGTSYAWTGYGPLSWGGNTFLGVGSLAGVGTITEGLQVRADGTTVSLSGIDPTLYAASMDDVQVGATANIWFALLSQGVMLNDPYLMFSGQVDKPTVNTGAESITISLALENRMRLLQRPSSRRYTNADQRRFYSDDTAFGWVETLNDQALRWGASHMALTRKPTWSTRELPVFLTMRKTDSFSWGKCDCCLIAADAILAMTGTDIAEDFRDNYPDEASAFALIKSVTGGTTVADAAVYCATKHGLTEWRYPLQAQRGDLVVLEDGPQLIAGFVHTNGTHAVSMGVDGFRFLPLTQVTRAWKV